MARLAVPGVEANVVDDLDAFMFPLGFGQAKAPPLDNWPTAAITRETERETEGQRDTQREKETMRDVLQLRRTTERASGEFTKSDDAISLAYTLVLHGGHAGPDRRPIDCIANKISAFECRTVAQICAKSLRDLAADYCAALSGEIAFIAQNLRLKEQQLLCRIERLQSYV